MNQSLELLAALRNISKKLRIMKDQEIEKLGLQDLSISNLKYIEAIHKLKNPTFVELTSSLGLSKPSVTIMVNKLIKNGYVKKSCSSTDKRVSYLTLTQKSETIIRVQNKMYEDFSKEISQLYNSNELIEFIKLLKRIK